MPVRNAKKHAKTPIKKRKKDVGPDVPSSERRRSGRNALQRSYAEQDDSQDEAELEEWNEDADEAEEDDEVNDSAESSRKDANAQISMSKPKTRPKVNGHYKGQEGKNARTTRIEISSDSKSGDGLSMSSGSDGA